MSRKSTVARAREMWYPVEHSCKHVESHLVLKKIATEEARKLSEKLCTECQRAERMNQEWGRNAE